MKLKEFFPYLSVAIVTGLLTWDINSSQHAKKEIELIHTIKAQRTEIEEMKRVIDSLTLDVDIWKMGAQYIYDKLISLDSAYVDSVFMSH